MVLAALLACISTYVHARQCGGTLVVRTTGGQMYAIVVPKNGGAISPRTFGTPVDCAGAFALDGYNLLCVNSSGTGLDRYNFEGEPKITFSLNGYTIQQTSSLYYNANSSAFCATRASNGLPVERLCGNLNEATQKMTLSLTEPTNTSMVYDALIGWPSPTSFTLLQEATSNGARTLWQDGAQGLGGGSPFQVSAISHLVLSDNGRRQWHVHSNSSSLNICNTTTLNDAMLTCYNATFTTATNATSVNYLKLLRNTGASSANASSLPEDTCTSIVAYWSNLLGQQPKPKELDPGVGTPISVPTGTTVPGATAPSATIPGTQQQQDPQMRRHDPTETVAGRTTSPTTTMTAVPISIVQPSVLAPPPPASPASPSPVRLNTEQVNFFDCPEPTLANPTPDCTMGETLLSGSVAEMAWTSVEFKNLNYTSTSGACPMPGPGESFVCVDGVWTSFTDVNTTIIIATGPVTVFGNVNVSESIVINGFQSSLIVNGCLILNGSIIIELSDDDLDKISKKTGAFTYEYYQLLLSSQNCPFTNSSQLDVQVRKTGKNQCAKVSMDAQTDSEHKLLAGIFRVNRTSCNIWWIILVSVLCGVVLLAVIVLVLVFTLSPKARLLVRPFSAKRAPENTGVK